MNIKNYQWDYVIVLIQEKINERLNGLEYVRAYIDGVLIISNDIFEVHTNKAKKNYTNSKQLINRSMQINYFRQR